MRQRRRQRRVILPPSCSESRQRSCSTGSCRIQPGRCTPTRRAAIPPCCASGCCASGPPHWTHCSTMLRCGRSWARRR